MGNHCRHPTAARAISLSVALLSDQDDVPTSPAGITFRRVDKAFDLLPDDDLLLLHGAGMARELKRLVGEAEASLPPVVMIAPRLDWDDITLALELGAVSYLLEVRCPWLLGTALACARHGVSLYASAIAAEQGRLASVARERPAGTHRAPAPGPLSRLSPRERQVMVLVAAGHGVREVARKLFLTEKSVRNYLDRIYRKLGVRSRTAAILCWLGHLDLPPADRR
ncbi:response regulator transcription factor [Streptomyces sp. NPDC004539]|uniref:helix-turn-helix transcriptional regulator n=1 Tax=Streptomyces sp. NPDC004539 TaxID=3154280 RepID=UPI0033B76088